MIIGQSARTVNPSPPEQSVAAGDVASLRMKKGSAVYHTVKRAILLGELAPGAALVEQQIGARMGCSQGTVREALLRLQEDGLVARRGYRGTVVSDTTPAEAAEMAQIRIKLESVGIRRAAEVMSREEIDQLAALIDRAEAASRAEDAYSCSELDRQFHLTIFQASGLIALEPILSRCALHMHRYTFRHPDETKRQHETPVARQHLAVLDALSKRDPAAAETAVRSHIEAVIDLWSPTLRQAMSRTQSQSAAK